MSLIRLSSIQKTQFTEKPSKTQDGKCLTSFQRSLLKSKLTEELSPKYEQRIRIMLMTDEGLSQSKIAKVLDCSPSTVRHWMFVAQSGEAHHWKQNGLGRPTVANAEYKERLGELVRKSPRETKVPDRNYSYRQARWTAGMLAKHLKAELGVEVTARHINRLLKGMGLSTRPRDKYKEQHYSSELWNSRICIRDLAQVPLAKTEQPHSTGLELLNPIESGHQSSENFPFASFSD